MTRRDTLTEMLTRYREAQETLLAPDGGGSGTHPFMPRTWNASYRELERSLHILSDERPKQARMLLARYVDATQTRRRLIGKRDSKGTIQFPSAGQHLEVRTYTQLADTDRAANEWDCIVLTWPKWVKRQLVDHALDRLEEIYQGEPYLPTEMVTLDKAA